MVNPGYAPGAPAPQQGNGLAVAGMICGILSIVLFWVPIFGWILALLGVIFGAVGIAKANKVGKGKGMAIAGLACGALSIIISIATILFFVRAAKDVDKELRKQMKENQQQIEKDMKNQAETPDK